MLTQLANERVGACCRLIDMIAITRPRTGTSAHVHTFLAIAVLENETRNWCRFRPTESAAI